MKRVRRDAHIFEKAADGFYVEPAWCSERLFEVETFAPMIFDPACGWGTILRSAKAAGYDVVGGDIVDRKQKKPSRDFLFTKKDFFRVKNPREHQVKHLQSGRNVSIITNPPFDHVQEFCEHALSLVDKVAMIMLLRRLNAAHWLRKLPLKTIYLLTPRPSMPPGAWIAAGNKPGGGTQDFCWIVMQRGYRKAPQLKWLHRDHDRGQLS
jgi:hypothetical protein